MPRLFFEKFASKQVGLIVSRESKSRISEGDFFGNGGAEHRTPWRVVMRRGKTLTGIAGTGQCGGWLLVDRQSRWSNRI